MSSLTLSVSETFKGQLKQFSWVNWSEIAREEVMKKLVLENYMKIGNLADNERRFCEKIDWHPVDEFPLKEKILKEIVKRRKGKYICNG